MSDANLETLFYFLQYGTFAMIIYFTVMDFVRFKRYGKTILMGWLWMILWAIANCMIFPLLFTLLGYERAFDFSPETSGVLAVACMGWLFGVNIVSNICIFRLVTRGFKAIFHRINTKA